MTYKLATHTDDLRPCAAVALGIECARSHRYPDPDPEVCPVPTRGGELTMTTRDSFRADWAAGLNPAHLTATETWGLHILAAGGTGPVSQAAARKTLSLARLAVRGEEN